MILRIPKVSVSFDNEIAILNHKNIFCIGFVQFLCAYFILRRTHAQYGYCKKHPKSLLFNGDCMRCWK